MTLFRPMDYLSDLINLFIAPQYRSISIKICRPMPHCYISNQHSNHWSHVTPKFLYFNTITKPGNYRRVDSEVFMQGNHPPALDTGPQIPESTLLANGIKYTPLANGKYTVYFKTFKQCIILLPCE